MQWCVVGIGQCMRGDTQTLLNMSAIDANMCTLFMHARSYVINNCRCWSSSPASQLQCTSNSFTSTPACQRQATKQQQQCHRHHLAAAALAEILCAHLKLLLLVVWNTTTAPLPPLQALQLQVGVLTCHRQGASSPQCRASVQCHLYCST